MTFEEIILAAEEAVANQNEAPVANSLDVVDGNGKPIQSVEYVDGRLVLSA